MMGNDYTKIHTGYEVVFSWGFLSGGSIGHKTQKQKDKIQL